MSGVPPRKGVALQHAPRDSGHAAIGVRPRATPAPEPVPVAPEEQEPTAAPATKPTTSNTDRPKASRASKRLQTARATEPLAWPGADLPELKAPDLSFTFEDLLSGPARITTVHLPSSVYAALRQRKFELDRAGTPVTQGTLIAHALAFAFVRHEEWLSLSPTDGRRRSGDTNLSSAGKRTSYALTDRLRAATDGLLWLAVARTGDDAPAKLTLQATAIAWGLSRLDEWIEHALTHPVAVSSPDVAT